jgi:CRP/FNR family transcriptional regulator, cyclic AMP receptor protein
MITSHRDGCLARLRAIGLLRGCSRPELQALARLTCPLSVAPMTVLCRQGQRGREVFLIEQGVAVAVIDGIEVARLGPGSFFGEMAVLDGGPCTATVTAATRLDVLVMNPGEFALMLDEAPTIARRMLVATSGRLRLAQRPGHVRRPALSGG